MPKIRIARKQAEKKEFEDYQAEEGRLDYNIWYHKYVGQRRDISRKKRQFSKCVIARDAGWTKGCKSSDANFCLYFARGKCALGGECPFLHRLPTSKDEERIPITRDCFGREKHATDREDMGGVGSFKRECKILYVGGLKNVHNLESSLVKNFKEWGQLEYVRLFKEKCYAFVKYKLRLCAEFAKEAMDAHIIPGASFMLDIRWATEDPDDLATKRILQTRKQAIIEKVEQRGLALTDSRGDQSVAALTHNPSDTEETTATTTTTNPPKQESETSNKQKSKRRKETAKTMDAYSKYYEKFFPEMYEDMKTKMKAEIQAELKEKKAAAKEAESVERAKSQQRQHKAGTTGKEDLSYESYMHKQLREVTLRNKRKRESDQTLEKQRAALNSNVVDLYPQSEEQFGPSAPPLKKKKTTSDTNGSNFDY
mmetsp:Transcript_11208/g.41957  ORF Transcript_11208/g.41957 Transcript_11208/m.41957 type:complete len:425 (+) Transcript_11208:205-1479(+)